MDDKLSDGLASSYPIDVANAVLAVANAHAIISFTDRNGTITWVNSRFCDISGYRADELLGRNHNMLRSGVHPPEFYQEMWQTIVCGRTWNGEICNRRKDGRLYWVASTIMPMPGPHGRPDGYVSIRTDITSVKDSERQLRHKRDLQILVSEVASDLLAAGSGQLSGAIERALARCGEVFRLEHAWLVLYSGEGTRPAHTHEWSAPGVGPQITRIQHRARSELGWWSAQIERGPIVIDDVATLPPEARREQAAFISAGITSLVAVPLHAASAAGGFLGFDSGHAQRTWCDEEVRMLGILADLFSTAHARVEAERVSELNKERLRRGQIYANIGTWDWNMLTGELFWTERIAPLFGYPRGELGTSYENFLKAVHPDDREHLIAAVNACVEHDVPYNVEHRVVWPDGTVRWLQERGAVTRDETGRATQMLGVVQDIHDRKQAELRLAEREQLLREAQTLAHIGNWTAWQRTGRLDWSEEIYRIFGCEPGSFQPSVEAFMAAVHPDDRLLLERNQAMVEKTGRLEVTHRIVRPDGSIRYVHEVGRMSYDESGEPLVLTGTVQDVTTLKQTELALIAARDEAERANRAKSQFLSSMSHELRTPLNAILGFSQLLVEQAMPPEQCRESAEEIFRAGEHLLNLINEVLDVARIEAGKVELKPRPVCAAKVLLESLRLVRNLAESCAVELTCTADAEALVMADPIRLKQVLVNLLTNAIKYNRPGGCVEAGIAADSVQVRIEVRDTGIGIDPQRQQELFQPFSRLGAELLQVEGMGIGLNISKHLVELMGGSIGLHSMPGAGSTFWITLPAAAAADLKRTQLVPPAAAPEAVPQAIVKTVLYVEDNATNVKLVQQMLARRNDIQLLSALTPQLGLDIVARARPHLIMLDINLPDMDGYQLLNLLQADPDACNIPVVAVSAYAMQADIDRGIAAGFTDYITKPVNLPRLTRVLNQILYGRDTGQFEIL